MLSLDSPEWGQISHCYGPARNLPELLRHLALDPSPKGNYQAEPWFTLWSSLCHQSDAYIASYAAVPHIVEIAMHAVSPIDFSFFLLPAAIEVSRVNGRAPLVPEDLKVAYFAALARLPECALRHAGGEWSDAMLRSICTALAVSKGHYEFANFLLNMDQSDYKTG